MITLKIETAAASKSAIIGQFAAEFGFPDHWKANWDSFIDCMRDVLDKESGNVKVNVTLGSDVTRDTADFLHVLGILRGEYDTLVVSVNDNTDTFSERKAG